MEEYMMSRPVRLGIVLVAGLASYGVGGCSSSSNGDGTGGAPAGGTGGVANTGGDHGTGGSPATGGSGGSHQGTGGAVATGGSSTGGSNGTGGSSTGGTAAGGAATGGVAAGGKPGTGGHGGSGPGTGGAGGTTTPGTCQKGQTKAAEVVIMGESFYAIDPQYIEKRIEDNARKAGSLGASDKYRNVAVSGQPMSYIAGAEWDAATKGGASVKHVIMDGGGIDCLTGSSCPTCASTFKTLLGKMGTAGVQEVIYTRYPEPGNPPGSNASLKACLDHHAQHADGVRRLDLAQMLLGRFAAGMGQW